MKHKQVLAFYIRLSHEDLFKASGGLTRVPASAISVTYSTIHTAAGRICPAMRLLNLWMMVILAPISTVLLFRR